MDFWGGRKILSGRENKCKVPETSVNLVCFIREEARRQSRVNNREVGKGVWGLMVGKNMQGLGRMYY